MVLKLSVLVCAGKLLLIHPCGISVCYLKSRQAFARGLTGEEEVEDSLSSMFSSLEEAPTTLFDSLSSLDCDCGLPGKP